MNPGADRLREVEVRAAALPEVEAQQLHARPVLGEHAGADPFRRQRGELEHDREVVGQLRALEPEAGRGVEGASAEAGPGPGCCRPRAAGTGVVLLGPGQRGPLDTGPVPDRAAGWCVE